MNRTLVRMTLAVLFIGVLIGCRGQDMESAVPVHSANEIIAEGAPQSVRAFEQRAVEAAKQWRPDAYMTGAYAIVSIPGLDRAFTAQDRIAFDFRSNTDRQHWYSVGFDPKGTLDVFEFSYTIPQSDAHAIKPSDWPLDSLDAWRIMLVNGGNVLLEEYQQQKTDMRCSMGLRRWSSQLKPSDTGQTLWDVLCRDTTMLNTFHFWIDARTGEVIEKR